MIVPTFLDERYHLAKLGTAGVHHVFRGYNVRHPGLGRSLQNAVLHRQRKESQHYDEDVLTSQCGLHESIVVIFAGLESDSFQVWDVRRRGRSRDDCYVVYARPC